MTDNDAAAQLAKRQIAEGTAKSGKDYLFDEAHNPSLPAQMWFQESNEGEILFVVFYTQACRWSQCLGCNLPSMMSQNHIGFKALMAQIDYIFSHPEVVKRRETLCKLIVSNNGSILDQQTFSSTALMYLTAQINLHLPNVSKLTLETRAEYVDMAELDFIARALREGDPPATLEVAIGFEAFDERYRNEVFRKGLKLDTVENLCRMLAPYKFHLKCYFMLKPIPQMTNEEAIEDIHRAIDYLDEQSTLHGVKINMHLNPTYAAVGTPLETEFKKGAYSPPRLADVARAAAHSQGKTISVYLGLSDEGLACQGGSFIRPGDETLIEKLEAFNRTQDYQYLGGC